MRYAATTARRGAPAKLNAEQVLEAALLLVDEGGFEALSARQLALRLGVAPMTIYTYFGSMDDLLDHVVARLVAEKVTSVGPRPKEWRAVLRWFAHGLRELMLEHPAYAIGLQRRPMMSRPSLEASDAVLDALRRAGLSPRAAANAYLCIYSYVVGAASLQQARQASLERTGRRPEEERARVLAIIADSQLPRLIECGVSDLQSDGVFDAGLDTIIAGIAGSASSDS